MDESVTFRPTAPRLMDQVRETHRYFSYAYNTEKSYVERILTKSWNPLFYTSGYYFFHNQNCFQTLSITMVLHKKLTIKAPAQQVFAYWADFRNFQQFIPMIESVEILDDKRSRWAIHAPLGHKVLFESLITTFEPGKNLAWQSDHADGHARGDLRLTALGESTRVELDFEYSLHHNWMQNIARLVSHFGFPSMAFDHGLARIKEKIEKGDF